MFLNEKRVRRSTSLNFQIRKVERNNLTVVLDDLAWAEDQHAGVTEYCPLRIKCIDGRNQVKETLCLANLAAKYDPAAVDYFALVRSQTDGSALDEDGGL